MFISRLLCIYVYLTSEWLHSVGLSTMMNQCVCLSRTPRHGYVGLFTQYFLLRGVEMAKMVEWTGCTICPAQHMLYPLPCCRAHLAGHTMGTPPLFAVVLIVTQLWGTPVGVLSISNDIKFWFCPSTCFFLRLTDAESSLQFLA